MTRHTAEAYLAVLKYIEDNIFKLKPDKFMTDFEAGMRKAIREFYPNVALHGCWYHYCAALRRNALRLGLYDLLKNDWNARRSYRKLLNLPLLPFNKFIEGFKHIEQETRNFKLHKEFKKFFTYFKNYWLKLVYNHVLFSIYPAIHTTIHTLTIHIMILLTL